MGRRPRSIFCYLCPRNAALAARVCAAIALALRNQCPRAAATRARALVEIEKVQLHMGTRVRASRRSVGLAFCVLFSHCVDVRTPSNLRHKPVESSIVTTTVCERPSQLKHLENLDLDLEVHDCARKSSSAIECIAHFS
jgi:hypothetical protein